MQAFHEAARTHRNRGTMHVFLGHPLSDGADKTTVEPGNSYSPGVWTCGISVWVETGGKHYCPDALKGSQVEWAFGGEGGKPPILNAAYNAGALSVTHELASLSGEGTEDLNRITLRARAAAKGKIHLVVKDVGPAGARIDSLSWDEGVQRLLINGCMELVIESPQATCKVLPADKQYDSPMAVLSWNADLGKGESATIAFRTVHGSRPWGGDDGAALRHSSASRKPVSAGFAECEAAWGRELPARVFAPDPRVALVWERSAYHILAAMERGLPRIGAVNYPVFWIRDCVIVLRALDMMGRHDLARTGCAHLAPLYFSGGFGAEGDAPGEGIWALVSHARITHSADFLREVFPTIVERVVWLARLRSTSEPIYEVGENRLPTYMQHPAINFVCMAAENGLIQGRMDWHMPVFFINCWARAGYAAAAEAAEMLGEDALAREWGAQAEKVDAAIAEHLLPRYGNERDLIVTPYPTGALSQQRDDVRKRFAAWYRSRRVVKGKRIPEPLWTYFEAAQAHNALLLGLKKEAWVSLSGMLAPGSPWDVSAPIEGKPGGNEYLPFRNDVGTRGWLDRENALGGNMPHNWTSAEIVNCIRDVFVREDGDKVILGAGVPDKWLARGARFGVSDMPTDFGPVTYTVTVDSKRIARLKYQGPERFETDFKCVREG